MPDAEKTTEKPAKAAKAAPAAETPAETPENTPAGPSDVDAPDDKREAEFDPRFGGEEYESRLDADAEEPDQTKTEG